MSINFAISFIIWFEKKKSEKKLYATFQIIGIIRLSFQKKLTEICVKNHYLRRIKLFGLCHQAVQVSTLISFCSCTMDENKRWHFIITDWRAKAKRDTSIFFLLCVNRPIMNGLKHSFTARWQWARYESDRRDYIMLPLLWLLLLLIRLFFFVSNVVLNGGSGYTVWCDTLVQFTIRVQHKSVQTHKTTNRSINQSEHQIHQVVSDAHTHKKKRQQPIKKRRHSRDPKLSFFPSHFICETTRNK